MSDDDHELIRRRAIARAWNNDLAAAALNPLTDSLFVIGGDWNIAVLFDTAYPGTAPAGTQFFEARMTAGWHHALRKFSETEVRTYLDAASGPYELDHIFTDSELHSGLVDAKVLAEEPVAKLSDHAVLIADFPDVMDRSNELLDS